MRRRGVQGGVRKKDRGKNNENNKQKDAGWFFFLFFYGNLEKKMGKSRLKEKNDFPTWRIVRRTMGNIFRLGFPSCCFCCLSLLAVVIVVFFNSVGKAVFLNCLLFGGGSVDVVTVCCLWLC